jgi:hypothetical protein
MSRRIIRGKLQFESPHYRVYEKQPHILYITKDVVAPTMLRRDTRMRLDSDGYVPYVYRHPFEAEDNDCLRFAEALVKGVVRYTSTTCAYNVSGEKRKFGVSDQKNIELARKRKKNAAANPTVGQAYAIVRTNLRTALAQGEDLAPYHIAHVIAEDDEWRITLEADAGNEELKKPVFGIYSTSNEAKSFHDTYKEMYGETAAATIVLEKSD